MLDALHSALIYEAEGLPIDRFVARLRTDDMGTVQMAADSLHHQLQHSRQAGLDHTFPEFAATFDQCHSRPGQPGRPTRDRWK